MTSSVDSNLIFTRYFVAKKIILEKNFSFKHFET